MALYTFLLISRMAVIVFNFNMSMLEADAMFAQKSDILLLVNK